MFQYSFKLILSVKGQKLCSTCTVREYLGLFCALFLQGSSNFSLCLVKPLVLTKLEDGLLGQVALRSG